MQAKNLLSLVANIGFAPNDNISTGNHILSTSTPSTYQASAHTLSTYSTEPNRASNIQDTTLDHLHKKIDKIDSHVVQINHQTDAIHHNTIDQPKGRTVIEDIRHIWRNIISLCIDIYTHKTWYLIRTIGVIIISELIIFAWVVSWSMWEAFITRFMHLPWNTEHVKSANN